MDGETARKIRDEAIARDRDRAKQPTEVMVGHIDKWIAKAASAGESHVVCSDSAVLRGTHKGPSPLITGYKVNAATVLDLLAKHYREVGFTTDIENGALVIYW